MRDLNVFWFQVRDIGWNVGSQSKVLGLLWATLAPKLGVLGTSWFQVTVVLDPSWFEVGGSWAHFGSGSGGLWGVWAPFLDVLGAMMRGSKLGTNGYIWGPMGTHGYPWVPIGNHRHP